MVRAVRTENWMLRRKRCTQSLATCFLEHPRYSLRRDRVSPDQDVNVTGQDCTRVTSDF